MTTEGASAATAYRPCACARTSHGDVAWRCPNTVIPAPGRRSCAECRAGRCPVKVLIIGYCGHRRWVASPAPMNAEQRAIEKCQPCPECGSASSQTLGKGES